MTLTRYQKAKQSVDRLEKELENTERKIGRLQTATMMLKEGINKAKGEMDRAQGGNIIVSEHALVQYLCRIMGFKMKMLEDEILSKGTIERIQARGDGKYKCKGFDVVIKGNTVVTVYEN